MRNAESYTEQAFEAYVECALWSSVDEVDGETVNLDDVEGEIAPETLTEMRSELVDFLNGEDVSPHWDDIDAEQMGHDFWLTRNGHGAGFWDRGLGELGDKLSRAAKVYGGYDLYVGDDGQIHGQ